MVLAAIAATLAAPGVATRSLATLATALAALPRLAVQAHNLAIKAAHRDFGNVAIRAGLILKLAGFHLADDPHESAFF